MTVTISGLGGARPTNLGATGNQNAVSTVGLPDGGYVVIWTSNEQSYLMRRYDAAGEAMGPDMPVGGTMLAKAPEVALLPTGNLVIVFPGYYGIEAGVFTPSGERVASVPLPPSSSMSSNPSVVALSNGGYAIAWVVAEGQGTSLQLQHYSANSVAVGEPVRVATSANGSLRTPTMASLADGGYVLAWQTPASFGANLNAQRYDAAGHAVGGVIRLNDINADLREPDIIGLPGGGFVAVWQQYVMGDGYEILMRRYDASGAAVGGEMRANAVAAGDQVDPSISRMSDGGFVIAWSRFGEGGGAFARRFDSAGNPVTDEILLGSSATAFDRSTPTVTGLTGGGYVAAWAGYDADGLGVYHSRIVTRVDNVLSRSLESAVGDGADDEFLAAPGVLSAGDRIDGAGGFDRIRMTSAGTLDFTGVGLSNVEQVIGSAGDDVLIFDRAPAGVALAGGGGVDTLMLRADTNLADLNLSGAWRIAGAPGAAVAFTVNSLDQLAMVDGQAASVTVNAPSLTLTAEQRAGLFARGVDYVRDSTGILFAAEGWANLAPSAPTTAPMASAITGLADGNLAIVSTQGVRVVNQDGVALSGLVSLSNGNLGAQDATITAVDGGGFVVAWIDQAVEFMGAVRAQRFDASGAAVGAAFTVNGQASGSKLWPDIAACPDGGFVVVWGGQNGQNSSFQRFDAAGVRVGPEVNVSAYGNGRLSVSVMEDGRIVVAGQGYVGLYSAAGEPIGAPIPLGDRTYGQVAALEGGGFVVVWIEQNTNGFKVAAQRFDDAGGRLGDPLVLRESFDAGSATSITATDDGGFVIGWNIPGATSTSRVMVTQRFDVDGARLGAPVTASIYEGPTLTGLAGGGFATLWSTALGSGYTLSTVRPLDYHQLTLGVDLISGGAGATLVVAAPEAVGAGDVLRGGAGFDTLEMSGAGVLNLAAAVIEGFETVLGSSGNDTVVLTAAQLTGLTLIDGRGGTNVLSFASSTGPVSMTVGQAAGFGTVAGSAFGDRLAGDAGANILQGQDGDDILLGGGGNDVLMGGEGSDTADYSAAISGVNARLDTGIASNDGEGGTDTFVSIENLVGSAFNDVLAGDAGANRLSGGLGHDLIYAGAGDDIITGGAGVGDELFGGQGDDTYVLDSLHSLVEYAGEGVDTVLLAGLKSYTLAENVENATAVGTGSFVITGNALDNVLIGSTGDDVLRGGEGNDRIHGGAGIDTLEVSGLYSQYALLIAGDGFILKSADGRDWLTGVEYVRFSDGRVLDLMRLYDEDGPLVLPPLESDALGKQDDIPLVLPAVAGKDALEPLVLPDEPARPARWSLSDHPFGVAGQTGWLTLDADLTPPTPDPWA